MSDELNDILIECAKMRGCYPLMHRTLQEFNWFVTCCIFGWTEYDQYEMDRHVTEYPNGFSAMCDLREEVRAIHTRWKETYWHDDKELLRFADAFREYWIEQDAIYRKIELDEVIGEMKDAIGEEAWEDDPLTREEVAERDERILKRLS